MKELELSDPWLARAVYFAIMADTERAQTNSNRTHGCVKWEVWTADLGIHQEQYNKH